MKNRDTFTVRNSKRIKRFFKKLRNRLNDLRPYHLRRRYTKPKSEILLTKHGTERYRQRFGLHQHTTLTDTANHALSYLTKLLKKNKIKHVQYMKYCNRENEDEVFVFDVEYDYDKHTTFYKLVTCYFADREK